MTALQQWIVVSLFAAVLLFNMTDSKFYGFLAVLAAWGTCLWALYEIARLA